MVTNGNRAEPRLRSMGSGQLSPQARARLDALAVGEGVDDPLPSLGPFDPGEVAAWRRAQHEAWGEDRVPGEPVHAPVSIAGVDCLVAGPRDATGPRTDVPVVVYAHGGGFCLGSPGTALPITARLARVMRVVSVDYRLAPEHPFPAAWNDLAAVVAGVGDALGRPASFLAGDSAGGHLALSVALSGGADGHRAPGLRGVFAFSPVIAVEPGAPLFDAALGPLADTEVSGWPAGARRRLLLEPPAGPTPMVLVQSTDAEPLHGAVSAWVERAANTGVTVEHQVWPGLWHAWHYHRELPEAHDAVDTAAETALGWARLT